MLAKKYNRVPSKGLQGLADLTQQLHLNLQCYHDWHRAEIDRWIARRKTRKARKTGP